MILARGLKFVAISILMLVIMSTTASVDVLATGSWSTYGSGTMSEGDANYPQTQFSRNGVPYVAYTTTDGFDALNNKLVVKRFNGESWEAVGGDYVPNAAPQYMKMDFSPDNIPYVSYADANHGNKLTVKRFNGTTWELVGPAGFTVGRPDGHEIAFGSDGKPYAAYANIDENFDVKPVVQHFNGSSWDVLGSADISDPLISTTVVIAVTSANVPYIVYQDTSLSPRKIVSKRFNGTSWESVGDPTGFSEGFASAGSLVMSSEDIPYVSYFDFPNDLSTSIKRFNGTSWEDVGEAGITSGLTQNSKLALTSQGVPYVSYLDIDDGNNTTVQRFNGTSWEVVGANGIASGGVYMPQLAFDNRDIPYISYLDSAQNNNFSMQYFIGGPDQLDDPKTTTVANAETGRPVSITSSFGSKLTCSSTNKEADQAKQDTEYNYPDGLVNFCFDTEFNSNKVHLVFATNLQPQDVVVRKQNSSTGLYTTVAGASVARANLNGQAALAVSYTIVDNGPLDEDPAVGKITDPVGLAVATTGLADTGESTEATVLASVALTSLGLVGCYCTVIRRAN